MCHAPPWHHATSREIISSAALLRSTRHPTLSPGPSVLQWTLRSTAANKLPSRQTERSNASKVSSPKAQTHRHTVITLLLTSRDASRWDSSAPAPLFPEHGYSSLSALHPSRLALVALSCLDPILLVPNHNTTLLWRLPPGSNSRTRRWSVNELPQPPPAHARDDAVSSN